MSAARSKKNGGKWGRPYDEDLGLFSYHGLDIHGG
jgi:hypothetical protein